MFANFGPGQWLVLGVVMVLMFAGSKLPDAARDAGQVAADLQVRVA
jgi:Sec-independent protein translocase protein TatA